MATITIKIDERTKAGRTFLSLIELFTEKHKEIEIVRTPNEETLKAMQEAKEGKVIDADNVEDLLKLLKF